METTGSVVPARRGFGLPALGGLAYVVLFIAALLIAGSSPDGDAPPAKVTAYYSDSGNRDKILIAWLVVLVGVFCLIWFFAALRRLLLQIDPDGQWAWAASIGGTVYVTTTLVAFSLQTAIFTMSDDTYKHQLDPLLMHAANDTGYVIHAAGGAGMAPVMIAASLAAARAALVPRWLGITGAVLGVLAIFSVFFIPLFGIAIWLVVASVALFRTRAVVSPVA